MSSFKLAVLSDIHAYVGDKNSDDSVVGFGGPAREQRNPLLSLSNYVRRNDISADALICAGDICNKADIDGFSRAWTALHDLNIALKSTNLIATCGNHDLNSKYLTEGAEDDPDPKGALLSLEIRFPFSDTINNNQFWAQNFAFVDLGDNARALVLNTSAFHGWKEQEIEHGRVGRRTINAIIHDLKSLPERHIYILVCHHHLLPMNGWENKTDYQYVRKGSELLEALEKATRRSWLVIHGHRHHPRLINGPGISSCAPIVFGSASLGARITGVSNQFHLLTAEESEQPEHSSIVGTVKTWSWSETTDWMLFGRRSTGLPALCGFGFKGQVRVLADRLCRLAATGYITWDEATTHIPSLKYLNPEDLNHLDEELSKRGISVIPHSDGLPFQIGPTANI